MTGLARSATRAFACLLLSLLATGCGGWLFFPSRTIELTPDRIGLAYEDAIIESADGTKLHGWLLPAASEKTKQLGTVVLVHGNGANIGAHLGSVYWLPAAGYRVFLFDYRGFGRSEGTPDLNGAHQDTRAALEWAAAQPETGELYVLAQSLGGAIGLRVLAEFHEELGVRAAIVDSAPSSYRLVAREALAKPWLTKLLSFPLSFVIPDSPSPLAAAAELGELPVLFVHGDADDIVAPHHSDALSDAADRELVVGEGAGHIASLEIPAVRRRVLEFLADAAPR